MVGAITITVLAVLISLHVAGLLDKQEYFKALKAGIGYFLLIVLTLLVGICTYRYLYERTSYARLEVKKRVGRARPGQRTLSKKVFAEVLSSMNASTAHDEEEELGVVPKLEKHRWHRRVRSLQRITNADLCGMSMLNFRTQSAAKPSSSNIFDGEDNFSRKDITFDLQSNQNSVRCAFLNYTW